ncbi:DUF2142 domain-containing protein [Kozakia baliensis]|uniref:DUF2142 domain-containing protein n=1 Tax=Kozakia baliensis TaxID=153496 RepID=UPI0008798786|nr:DUF2142 domain-containing protein [Kozakia baliensis]AOX19375.1 hypothetical protein A0U90_02665 [Kozakia baliensis]
MGSLARLWFVLALPLAVIMMIMTPPFQTPDEQNHFFRAVQIGQGGIVGRKLNWRQAGGFLPEGAVSYASSFGDLPFHVERKVSWERIHDRSGGSWQTPNISADFGNTVIYAPMFYCAVVLGIDLGRIAHLSVRDSFYLARFCNILFCVVVGALAIAIARKGRLLIALILSLPMTLSLDGSCSQDGALIAAAALAAALLSRAQEAPFQGYKPWLVLGLMLGFIAASKPPYFLVLAFPALLMPRALWRQTLACAVLGAAILFAWSIFGVHPAKIPFQIDEGISTPRQVHFVLAHPLHMVQILSRTFHLYGPTFWREYLGTLGWLDTPLPHWFYRTATLFLLVGGFCALAQFPRKANRIALLRAALVSLIVAATTIGVCLALYLIWTPLGLDHIEGIQGRYFLAISLFAILALPAERRAQGRAGQVLVLAEPSILFLAFITGAFATTEALLARYW